MDLLKEIKLKVDVIREGDSEGAGLDAVIRHVEMAESHLIDGRKRAVPDYYTDAIYRSNQAFEGALKEAYQRLTGQDASRKSPSQIEQYLQSKKVLKPRVLQLLTNYRQEWRNSSTHDHRLFFESQEAFLAIVSVSAFASILLDQIIEFRAYEDEAKKLAKQKSSLPKASSTSRFDVVRALKTVLESYGKLLNKPGGKDDLQSGISLNGKVAAFLETVGPSFKMEQEVPIALGNSAKFYTDFVISRKGEAAVLEVKLINIPGEQNERKVIALSQQQMATYLRSYDQKVIGGVVFLVAKHPRKEVIVEEELVRIGDKELPVVTILA